MKFKKLILSILALAICNTLDATAYPCFTAFQVEIAGPAAAYQEEQDCCPDNSWYHLESQLSWNQSLDSAIANYDECCKDSDEIGC